MSLVDRGLGYLVAFIVIGAVAIPVAGQSLITEAETVTGEIHQPDDNLPTEFTLNNVYDGVLENSESLYFDETGDGSNLQELEKGDDYEVLSYDNGKFELLEAGTTSQDYNTNEGDEIQADYEYKPRGYLGGTSGTIANFVPLALALALFVAAIAMVN